MSPGAGTCVDGFTNSLFLVSAYCHPHLTLNDHMKPKRTEKKLTSLTTGLNPPSVIFNAPQVISAVLSVLAMGLTYQLPGFGTPTCPATSLQKTCEAMTCVSPRAVISASRQVAEPFPSRYDQ